ncbi:MAG: methionyl-tRNA formyltransferase [Fimbriimonadaceae bacterium]
MKLVYFGTSAFAVPALQALARNVALVVTQPDRPSGRGMATRASDVKNAATALGLQVETPEKSRYKAFVESLTALDADAFIVASYGQILSKSLLAVPKQGCFNLHASLLPKYRGAAPIQYAVLNGDTVTGVTLILMDAGMDTGDMIAKATTDIGPDETAGELHDRLAQTAAGLVAEWIERLVAGDFPHDPQTERVATYAPKVTKADAELDFERPAREEYDRYRAFTPAPGAWVRAKSGDLKIRAARLAARSPVGAAPGTVVATNPFEVAFSAGSLVFDTVQPEGRKAVSGPDFANGARIRTGDCLKP